MKKANLKRIAGIAVAFLPISLLATNSQAATSDTVNVVGYSIVSKAYTALETAFSHTAAGQGVTFTNSFGASTTQAEDVVAGQPADVVNFSDNPDLALLIDAGLVAHNWASVKAAKAQKGIVTDSVVAIVVKPGNPLGIHTWNDLTNAGVKIVTPDPISSGSARWNLLAAYESQIDQGSSPAQADTYINALIKNVISEPSSGSKALSAFIAGTGNVLLAYESDALNAFASGQKIAIVEPAQNLLIQNPAALTMTGSTNPGAIAFYKFIFGKAGQQIWLQQHFRPTLASLQPASKTTFYTPGTLNTITKLGGWAKVTPKFFSTTGIITQAENANGYTS
ncbi:MAG: extracellular solute-binding protein [Acidimicrobiales bacterium]|jgi:sulfate transport system substrate-binding protein